MNAEPHVDDVGTSIRVTLIDQDKKIMDLSSATLLQIIAASPDKRRLVWNASFVTDGKDGQIEYVIQAGDLNVNGTWRLQAKVQFPSGSWSSTIGAISIIGNL